MSKKPLILRIVSILMLIISVKGTIFVFTDTLFGTSDAAGLHNADCILSFNAIHSMALIYKKGVTFKGHALCLLFDRYGFCEVSGFIDIAAAQQRHII